MERVGHGAGFLVRFYSEKYVLYSLYSVLENKSCVHIKRDDNIDALTGAFDLLLYNYNVQDQFIITTI